MPFFSSQKWIHEDARRVLQNPTSRAAVLRLFNAMHRPLRPQQSPEIYSSEIYASDDGDAPPFRPSMPPPPQPNPTKFNYAPGVSGPIPPRNVVAGPPPAAVGYGGPPANFDGPGPGPYGGPGPRRNRGVPEYPSVDGISAGMDTEAVRQQVVAGVSSELAAAATTLLFSREFCRAIMQYSQEMEKHPEWRIILRDLHGVPVGLLGLTELFNGLAEHLTKAANSLEVFANHRITFQHGFTVRSSASNLRSSCLFPACPSCLSLVLVK